MRLNTESENMPPDNLIKSESTNENSDQKKKSECSICGQKFTFLKALRKHEERHQGDGGFVCNNCGMKFTTVEAREKHRDKVHKVLRCKICNIKFKEEAEYLSHINSLHDGRDRELSICSACGKQFKTKGELTHHAASKCGTVKKYQCSVCLQTLMTPGSLHNHMLRHTGKRTYMCRFCAKTFLTAGQLTVHERIHTQEKAFICEVCNKGFCHRQSLITHSTLHTGIKPYQCEGCGNSFSCVGNLLKHRKTHSDSCGKIPLTTHRVKHPSTKIKVQVNTPATSKLRTCQKRKKIEQTTVQTVSEQKDTFNSSEDLEIISNDNGTNNLIMNNIQENFGNHLINENNIVHSNINIKLQEDYNKVINDSQLETTTYVKQENWAPLKLNNDEQNFTNLVTYQKYEYNSNNLIYTQSLEKNDEQISIKPEDNNTLAINHDINDNQDECIDDTMDWPEDNHNESSEDSVDLQTRKTKQSVSRKEKVKKTAKVRKKQTVDKAELQQFIEERGFDEVNGMNCKYCGSHYSVPLWLLKHEQKHEETLKNGELKIFKCSCCSKTFQSKEECVNHQQFEHVNELTCKQCDRIFANPDSLKAHHNFSHLGVPRKRYVYVCEKCGRVFKQKALLVIHEQTSCASGKLYPCQKCGKGFSSKHVLKSHMRVHEPEKSLLCKFCGKSFHWKGQLKIHERSHTGETPFKCQFCPKSFAYRESLITHNTLHTGIKPHLCEACGSRFSCIGNLLKHRRTHANTCGLISQVKTEVVAT